jgi:hypothetical protein
MACDHRRQFLQNPSDLPLHLQVGHLDRIVQLDQFTRLQKHRGAAGRDVMDNARDLSPHLVLDRHDIAALALGEILFLKDFGIALGSQDGIQPAAHLLLQAGRMVREAAQLRRGGLPDVPLGIHRAINGDFELLEIEEGLKRAGGGGQRRDRLAMFSQMPDDVRANPQHGRDIAQFVGFERSAFGGPADRLPDVRKRQGRERIAPLQQGHHLGGFLEPGLCALQIGFEWKRATMLRAHGRTGLSGQDVQNAAPFEHRHRLIQETLPIHGGNILSCSANSHKSAGPHEALTCGPVSSHSSPAGCL